MRESHEPHKSEDIGRLARSPTKSRFELKGRGVWVVEFRGHFDTSPYSAPRYDKRLIGEDED